MSLIFWPQIAQPLPYPGDTKLWVPFVGNVSNDIGPYNLGAGSNTGATLSGDALAVNGTTLQHIDYGSTSVLGIATGNAYTMECFITWTSSANATEPGNFFALTLGTTIAAFGCYGNTGQVIYHHTGATPVNSAGNVLAGVTKAHCAVVRPAGTGVQTRDLYVAGTRIGTFTELSEPTNANGTIVIGKATGAGQSAVYNIYDFRFTKRALYSGASFTPPAYPF